MRIFGQLIISFMLFVLVAGLTVPVLAQNIVTRTLTEEQINASYRATNPRRAVISQIAVDLQPGQVVISATHTYRWGSVQTITTTIPYIQDGRIYWQVVSIVTGEGQAASPDLIDQVNASIMSSWRNYIRGQVDGIISSVTVTDADITFSLTPGERLDDAVEAGTVNREDTPRLWNLWDRRQN